MRKPTVAEQRAIAEFLQRSDSGEPTPDETRKIVEAYLQEQLPKRRGRPPGTEKLSPQQIEIAVIQFAMRTGLRNQETASARTDVASIHKVDTETMRKYLDRHSELAREFIDGNFPDSVWGKINVAVQTDTLPSKTLKPIDLDELIRK